MKFFLPGQQINPQTVNYGNILAAEDFWKQFFEINSKSNPFPVGDKKYGALRNIMVNVKEIQRAFGVDYTKIEQPGDSVAESLGQVFDSSIVKPPATVKEGVMNLLNALSRNFFNFWKRPTFKML